MTVKLEPHYTLSANTLAVWIEGKPQGWWLVDGDPVLMSRVDFPCPSDELAPEIRKIGKPLLVRDQNPRSHAAGEPIESGRLDELSEQRDRRYPKTLKLTWQDSNVDWLLIQDRDPDAGA